VHNFSPHTALTVVSFSAWYCKKVMPNLSYFISTARTNPLLSSGMLHSVQQCESRLMENNVKYSAVG
jgi:hypothetical protein